MKIIKKPIKFEWDEGNLNKNLKKHQISNEAAEQVFSNIPVVYLEDDKHSGQEKRYLILGTTDKKTKLSIIFTIRKDKVRIISARPMSQKERNLYEKTIK